MTDLLGKSIDHFHITMQLGRGGMAIVYKAFDTILERNVAIKLIRKEAFSPKALKRVLKRFDREAKALARLSHTNIITIHNYGNYQGSPYLIMEYLSGGSLKDLHDTPMRADNAAKLLAPIAKALAHSHQEGIIHRDIKPSNILLNKNGVPKLTDFGIAHILESNDATTLTATGVGVGTPEYMSPEQGLGKKIDARADIYSLCVVLYELVTGQKPFEADTPMAVVVKHINEPIPPPTLHVSDLPKEVEKIITKGMAKEPENRYQEMDAFALALEHIAQEIVIVLNDDEITHDEFVLPGDVKESMTPPRPPKPCLIPCLVGGVALILIVIFWIYFLIYQ